MKYVCKSDVGKKRSLNEDFYAASNKFDLFILADGMGGHNAGEVASKMAVSCIKEYLEVDYEPILETDVLFTLLNEAIIGANDLIYTKAKEDEKCFGMGTTLDVALVNNGYVYIAHIGDGRIYKITNNDCILLTKDHSIVYDLLRSGQITKEEAKNHPDRNKITRALGTEEEIEIDFIKEPLDDAVFLMCSDGLSNMVSEEEIAYIVRNNDLDKASIKLIEKANEAGGDDNITVILFSE